MEGGGGNRKKNRKKAKKAEKNTFKPLSTIFVPCMKIQGAPLPPGADAHDDEPFDMSNNDEHIPVTSSSESKNNDLQDPPNTMFWLL